MREPITSKCEGSDQYDRLGGALPHWRIRAELGMEKDVSQDKFKEYVHSRLDEAGVTVNPNGKHSAEGCRIGDRLDELIGERDKLRQLVNSGQPLPLRHVVLEPMPAPYSKQINVLDHGYVRFVEDMGRGDAGEPEAGIIEAARQSTQASFRGWEDGPCTNCGYPKHNSNHHDCCPDGTPHKPQKGDASLLRFLFSGKPQHATPFEFCELVIEVQAPIFVFREWHRHRTQSYNEMSARYAPLPNLNYVPTVERLMMNVGTRNKQAGAVADAEPLTEVTARDFINELRMNYQIAETDYQTALASGVPKELARLVIPVGRYSRMRAKANLRNWLAFMTLRADPGAQWEIRQYAEAVGSILAERFPRTWALYVEGRTKS